MTSASIEGVLRIIATRFPVITTFDELALEISLVEFAETLHAKFYLYEFNFLPSGVSVVALSVEDTPEESIFSGP